MVSREKRSAVGVRANRGDAETRAVRRRVVVRATGRPDAQESAGQKSAGQNAAPRERVAPEPAGPGPGTAQPPARDIEPASAGPGSAPQAATADPQERPAPPKQQPAASQEQPTGESVPADAKSGAEPVAEKASEVKAARPGAEDATVIIPRQRPRPAPRPRLRPRTRTGPSTGAGGTTGAPDDGRTRQAPKTGGGASPQADVPASAGTGFLGRLTGRAGSAPELTRHQRMTALGLVVLLVASLVTAGLMSWRWYDQRQLDNARNAALAAARQTTVNFVSISASTVDRDLKRISDGATGEFKDEFTRDTAQVRATVLANKVDSHGTVLRAATVSANRRSAVVLVAIDATVKNTGAPDGRLSHYRIQVNLSRDSGSGRWLVAQLQFVG